MNEYAPLTYEQIMESGLVTPSLAEVLYGDSFSAWAETLSYSYRINHIHNLLLLYSVLIEAYIVAEAISNRTEIDGLELPEPMIQRIRQYWTGTFDLAEGNNVFSFLTDWVRAGRADIIAPELPVEYLADLSRDFADYQRNTRFQGTYDPQSYLELLECLPLLRSCELLEDRDLLQFKTAAGKLEVSCIPFLFHNRNANFLQRQERHKGFTFSSARKGERNNWPIVSLWGLNSGERKLVRLDAANESVRQICRAVGISTQWYSVEDCWCDLAYLKRVIDATNWVLMKYFGVNEHQRQDLFPRIRELYHETDLYDKLTAIADADGKVNSNRESVEAFFYEMFINFGIFKSLHGLFMDPWEHPYSEKLFSLYLQYFRSEGMLTEEREKAILASKQASIQEHVEKLKRISPKNSYNYRFRKREIIAEWTAFAVLQAAGFDSTNKLFADRERMLSIDDYYHMVRNPNTTLEGDLSEVLLLLDCIYGPLVDTAASDTADFQFDEAAYRTAMLAESRALHGKNITELFDRFLEITRRSQNHPAIEKLLGRNDICDPDTVDSYRREILRRLQEQPGDAPVESPSRKRFFISYCHEDSSAVLQLCRQLEERQFQIVLDDQKFEVGSNWKERAKREISSPDCVGVIVFASESIAFSEAVEFELTHAERNKKKILPVNLTTDRTVYEYLDEIDHTMDSNTHYADSLKKFFSKHTIYARPDNFVEKLLPDMERLVTDSEEHIGEMIRVGPYSPLEEQVINFYALLKYGFGKNEASFEHKTGDRVDEHFSEETEKRNSVTRCVFPLIVSVRETKIKRDNIALIGYEIIKSNTSSTETNQYILSSRRLDTDDYYCIPNYRLTGTNGLWMVEPFLIKRLELSPKSEVMTGAEP